MFGSFAFRQLTAWASTSIAHGLLFLLFLLAAIVAALIGRVVGGNVCDANGATRDRGEAGAQPETRGDDGGGCRQGSRDGAGQTGGGAFDR